MAAIAQLEGVVVAWAVVVGDAAVADGASAATPWSARATLEAPCWPFA